MAAYNTAMNNFLKTASVTSYTKMKINKLAIDYENIHDMGM